MSDLPAAYCMHFAQDFLSCSPRFITFLITDRLRWMKPTSLDCAYLYTDTFHRPLEGYLSTLELSNMLQTPKLWKPRQGWHFVPILLEALKHIYYCNYMPCRTGILTPVFESYAKPFPRQQPWLDYWRVVGDASPGVVDITNITLSDWTKQPYWSECPTSALQVNPSSLDLNPVHQVKPCLYIFHMTCSWSVC